MTSHIVSVRIPNENPRIEAFVDLTYAWLEELAVDFERCMGFPFEGGNGVLIGCDVLVLLHGEEADWARWDVAAFERAVREQMPGFEVLLPTMLADLLAFLNLHTRRGRVPIHAYEATEARFYELRKLPAA